MAATIYITTQPHSLSRRAHGLRRHAARRLRPYPLTEGVLKHTLGPDTRQVHVDQVDPTAGQRAGVAGEEPACTASKTLSFPTLLNRLSRDCHRLLAFWLVPGCFFAASECSNDFRLCSAALGGTGCWLTVWGGVGGAVVAVGAPAQPGVDASEEDVVDRHVGGSAGAPLCCALLQCVTTTATTTTTSSTQISTISTIIQTSEALAVLIDSDRIARRVNNRDILEDNPRDVAALLVLELDVAAEVRRERGAVAEGDVRDRHGVGGAHNQAVALPYHGVLDKHVACGRLYA